MSQERTECEAFLRHCCEQTGCLRPQKGRLHLRVQDWQLQFLQAAEGHSVLEQPGMSAELCLALSGHRSAVLGGCWAG